MKTAAYSAQNHLYYLFRRRIIKPDKLPDFSGFDRAMHFKAFVIILLLLENALLAVVWIDWDDFVHSTIRNIGQLALVNLALVCYFAFPELLVGALTRLPKPHTLWIHVVISWLMICGMIVHAFFALLSMVALKGTPSNLPSVYNSY